MELFRLAQHSDTAIIDALTDALHGSGWDGDWTIRRCNHGGAVATIGFHHMSEMGYYDGWSMVNLHLSPGGKLSRVTFTTDDSTRRRYITWQRDYFDDCAHDAALDMVQTLTDRAPGLYTYETTMGGLTLEIFDPEGKSVIFLQGEDADTVAADIATVEGIWCRKFGKGYRKSFGPFHSCEEHISAILSQYDLPE